MTIDPARLAYLPDSNTLLISDCEVDEMPRYFTGKNLSQLTLSGDLINTRSTISFSNEPTGVAVNPLNKHLFFTDDDRMRIFELNPGADGLYNTSDDIVTFFKAKYFGCTDPEGIAFDSWRGHLLIVDGLGGRFTILLQVPMGYLMGCHRQETFGRQSMLFQEDLKIRWRLLMGTWPRL